MFSHNNPVLISQQPGKELETSFLYTLLKLNTFCGHQSDKLKAIAAF
jgi:hypothetical protein